MMKHRTIRSTAQRQILTWLRHGPSTVSEIAEQFSMRMPHASLACRQLREAGLITRDERGGLRNAPIYLSQGGMDRLVEDAVGKMQQHAALLRTSAQSHVLHADENNVLLAYIEPPESSFVYIGETPETEGGNSSGNPGGAWVLAPTSSIQWFSRMKARLTRLRREKPAPWQRSNPRHKLVCWGVVVEQRGHHALLEGQPFDALYQHDASTWGSLERVKRSVPGLTGGFSPSPGLLGHLRSASPATSCSTPAPGALVQATVGRLCRCPFLCSATVGSSIHEWPPAGSSCTTIWSMNSKQAILNASPLMRSLLMDLRPTMDHGALAAGAVNLHGITERGVLSILHPRWRRSPAVCC